MKDWLKENWFKAGLLGIIFIAGLSIAYYYVIFLPQKEEARLELQRQEHKAKLEQQKLLDFCLEETDNEAWKDFISICKDDERINGGDIETCEMGTVEDTISYMYASYLRETLFKGVLERREKAKEDCFKKYPVK